MDELLGVILTIIVVLLVLAIATPLLAGIIGTSHEIEERVPLILERGRSQIQAVGYEEQGICIESSLEGNGWKHTVKINSLDVMTKEDVRIYPAVLFKGERAAPADENGDIKYTSTFDLQKNQLETITSVVLELNSVEPPMIKGPESIENNPDVVVFYDYPQNGKASVKQKILMKNFVIEYVNYLDPKLILDNLPGIRLSTCIEEIGIECKSDESRAFLFIPSDRETCDGYHTCMQTFNMCGGEITAELLSYENPGEPCANKNPKFKFTVNKDAEEWKTGEEVFLSFWKYDDTGNSELQSCWNQELLTVTENCFDMLFGVYKTFVPPGTPCV